MKSCVLTFYLEKQINISYSECLVARVDVWRRPLWHDWSFPLYILVDKTELRQLMLWDGKVLKYENDSPASNFQILHSMFHCWRPFLDSLSSSSSVIGKYYFKSIKTHFSLLLTCWLLLEGSNMKGSPRKLGSIFVNSAMANKALVTLGYFFYHLRINIHLKYLWKWAMTTRSSGMKRYCSSRP